MIGGAYYSMSEIGVTINAANATRKAIVNSIRHKYMVSVSSFCLLTLLDTLTRINRKIILTRYPHVIAAANLKICRDVIICNIRWYYSFE